MNLAAQAEFLHPLREGRSTALTYRNHLGNISQMFQVTFGTSCREASGSAKLFQELAAELRSFRGYLEHPNYRQKFLEVFQARRLGEIHSSAQPQKIDTTLRGAPAYCNLLWYMITTGTPGIGNFTAKFTVPSLYLATLVIWLVVSTSSFIHRNGLMVPNDKHLFQGVGSTTKQL